MADGLGLGGLGTVEPYGSLEEGALSSPVSSALATLQGILEATSGAIGEADNEIGGLYLTRLIEVVNAGVAVFPVETTEDWGSTGSFAVDGIVYYYTGKTEQSFTGVTHIAGGSSTVGAAIDHRIESAVVDISRTRSSLDELRRAMLVDYAEGEDLSVIGRNLAVNRLPVVADDDQFRELIKVLAYNPKGTVLGITLVLEALMGAGNAEVYEFHAQYPNIVFIKLDQDTLLDDISAGRTFMNSLEYDALYGSSDTLQLADGAPLAIGGVKIKEMNELLSFRDDKPSAVTYAYYPGETPNNAFSYDGTESESTAVTVTADSHCRFTVSAGGTTEYRMNVSQGARIQETSYVEVTSLIRVPSTATLTAGALFQFAVRIDDGDYRVSWGMENTREIGIFDSVGGGFIGGTITLATNTFYEVTIRKYGTDRVELWVDGVLISTVQYSLFTQVVSTRYIAFGCIWGAANGMQSDWRQMGVKVTNDLDYWTARETDTGDVLAANPNRLTLNGSTAYTFISGDVGKAIRISGSEITNTQGGNNNGRWVIATFNSGTSVELSGVEKEDATLDGSNPTRITVADNEAFTYPDDLGKQIVISGSAASNDGTYVISKLLQLGTLTDLATFDTELSEQTNVCEVVSATFTSEVDLTYKLMPNFADESNLDWEQSDAGSISGDTLTLRQALWTTGIIMDIEVSRVVTGQVLEADDDNVLLDTEPNIYEFYPFYLHDPFALIKSYVDAITVAGVKPEYIIE